MRLTLPRWAGTLAVKAAAVVKIARIMGVTISEVLPWKRLAAIAIWACVAAGPALWVSRGTTMPPLASLASTAAAYAGALAIIWIVAMRWQAPREPDRFELGIQN